MHQMDYISQEMNRIESTGRIIEEQVTFTYLFNLITIYYDVNVSYELLIIVCFNQLKELAHVEEESEIVRQQEKTLKSEITLLRSKLANCETELLQCKNKIR